MMEKGDVRLLKELDRLTDIAPESVSAAPISAPSETASSSSHNEATDDSLLNVIYSITADESNVEAMKNRFTSMNASSKSWDDDVNKMNLALAKEGFDSSIVELYSPKRVTGMADMMNLMPGMALDLSTNDTDGKPWDFNDPVKRSKAEDMVRDKRALLLIGSPMCSAFSSLQNINYASMTKEDVEAKHILSFVRNCIKCNMTITCIFFMSIHIMRPVGRSNVYRIAKSFRELPLLKVTCTRLVCSSLTSKVQH